MGKVWQPLEGSSCSLNVWPSILSSKRPAKLWFFYDKKTANPFLDPPPRFNMFVKLYKQAIDTLSHNANFAHLLMGG